MGAIPPLMGWAGAAGQLEWGAGVLAAALFSWQMPHFMALAWMCKVRALVLKCGCMSVIVCVCVFVCASVHV